MAQYTSLAKDPRQTKSPHGATITVFHYADRLYRSTLHSVYDSVLAFPDYTLGDISPVHPRPRSDGIPRGN